MNKRWAAHVHLSQLKNVWIAGDKNLEDSNHSYKAEKEENNGLFLAIPIVKICIWNCMKSSQEFVFLTLSWYDKLQHMDGELTCLHMLFILHMFALQGDFIFLFINPY